MRYLKGFGRFWYDFIIGDDWKIAAGVVVILGAAGIFVASGGAGGLWLPPVVALGVAAAFCVAVAIDVRSNSDR